MHVSHPAAVPCLCISWRRMAGYCGTGAVQCEALAADAQAACCLVRFQQQSVVYNSSNSPGWLQGLAAPGHQPLLFSRCRRCLSTSCRAWPTTGRCTCACSSWRRRGSWTAPAPRWVNQRCVAAVSASSMNPVELEALWLDSPHGASSARGRRWEGDGPAAVACASLPAKQPHVWGLS